MKKEIEILLEKIDDAFDGVTLGNGISWREADALDDYADNDTRMKARAKDELHDWRKVPFDLIRNYG